jgi:oxygen-independent coproporphyrinogen-3 oxidase
VVNGILEEFTLRRQKCQVLHQNQRQLTSVYLGGGTPSLLPADQMERLLAGILDSLVFAPDLEVTAEANPESFAAVLAQAWQAMGINRVSLGVQSFADPVLGLLGRGCTGGQARQAVRLACQIFPRVSCDWILGPGVQRATLLAELSTAVATGVGHISLYILELHPDTPLAAAVARGEVTLPAEAEIEEMYLAAAELLGELGLQQYEVANFARPGQESRHNRRYWLRKPYLGLGPGAHGFWGNRRYANQGDIPTYLSSLQKGFLPEETVDWLDLPARKLERVFLALRTSRGVPVAQLPLTPFPWREGVKAGLWHNEAGWLKLTTKGFLRIDGIAGLLSRSLPGLIAERFDQDPARQDHPG